MLIVKTPKKSFQPPDEGWQRAKLVEIRDLGLVQTLSGMREKILLVYETQQLDQDGKPRKVFVRFSKTLHAKGNLRRHVRSVLGRDPGEEFDMHALLGITVDLNIEHSEKNGTVYANVAGIARVKANGSTIARVGGSKTTLLPQDGHEKTRASVEILNETDEEEGIADDGGPDLLAKNG
jgi:hypothetical protein